MNFFSASQPDPRGEEAKSPVAPKTPALSISNTHKELRAASKNLAFALPALVVKEDASRKSKKGKRDTIRFPGPNAATRLNKVYDIIQTTSAGAKTSSTSIEVCGGLYFTLGDLNQYAQLTSVFDQYRCKAIEISFLPRVNVSDAYSVVTPMFGTCVDVDDASAPAGFNYIGDHQGALITESYKPHKHTFVPHIAVAAYSGTFTSYENVTAPWIDCASTGVQHYGVKYAFTVTAVQATYDTVVRIWWQFRNVR